MSTVINNPGNGTTSGGDEMAGIVIGVVLVLILVVLFFLYGLPAIRNNTDSTPNNPGNTTINVDLPTPTPSPTPAPTTP